MNFEPPRVEPNESNFSPKSESESTEASVLARHETFFTSSKFIIFGSPPDTHLDMKKIRFGACLPFSKTHFLGDHFWCPEVRKRISRGPPWRPGYYLRGGGPCFVPAALPSGTPSRQILRMEPFQLLRDPFGTLWDPFLSHEERKSSHCMQTCACATFSLRGAEN